MPRTQWRCASPNLKARHFLKAATLIARSNMRGKAMSVVKSVAVHVSSPSPADPAGRATVGFYVLEGDVLTMTDGDGKPVRRRYSGEVYKQKLAEGDDPSVIAKRLTLSIWRSNTGGDASGGFNRRLNYPPIGIV
jgi:hypothetical protein